MAEGSIKKLTDKGFGFINTGGAKDLFFHSKSLQGVTFEALREGQKVSYTRVGVRKARVPRTSRRCSSATCIYLLFVQERFAGIPDCPIPVHGW